MCARVSVALAAAFEEEDREGAKVCRCPVVLLLLLKTQSLHRRGCGRCEQAHRLVKPLWALWAGGFRRARP